MSPHVLIEYVTASEVQHTTVVLILWNEPATPDREKEMKNCNIFTEYRIKFGIIKFGMNLMSMRRWILSSSSSFSFWSWQTPWKTITFLVYLLWLILICDFNSQTHFEKERALTINLVSPLDSVSVMKSMDSKWSTTAWRSLGYRDRTIARIIQEREQTQSRHWSVTLPVSQIERWSSGESEVYQYHHSTPLLQITNTFHSILTHMDNKQAQMHLAWWWDWSTTTSSLLIRMTLNHHFSL